MAGKRLYRRGAAGADPGINVKGGGAPPPSLISRLPLPSCLLPFLSLRFPFLPLIPLLLRSRAPLNQLGGLGERCKLPQRGPGGTPAVKEFGAL